MIHATKLLMSFLLLDQKKGPSSAWRRPGGERKIKASYTVQVNSKTRLHIHDPSRSPLKQDFKEQFQSSLADRDLSGQS